MIFVFIGIILGYLWDCIDDWSYDIAFWIERRFKKD